MDNLEEKLRYLDETYPLIRFAGPAITFSTVRRMKAEAEHDIPIARRTGVAISLKNGKRANEMNEEEWQEFYQELCEDLKEKYPTLYQRVFPDSSVESE